MTRLPGTVFCGMLCAILSALCLPAEGQQPTKLRQIGFLCPAKCGQVEHDGFRDGLSELGYIEGRDITITRRAAESNTDRLPGLAAELVALKADVIVTASTPAISALKEATNVIPIAFASAGDGRVRSCCQPCYWW